jgi:hypothetical protein
MKLFLQVMTLTVLGCFILTASAADSSELDALQGKWSAKRTSDQGQAYSQIVEIEKDKLTFRVVDSDDQVRFFARGTVRTAQHGPFKVIQLSNIHHGRSADETEPSSEEMAIIYRLDSGSLSLATNFDKARERQKPEAVTYTRAEVAKGSDGDKLIGNWEVEVKREEASRDYELRIMKSGAGLGAVLISPRSGEHKAKTVMFKDNIFLMEFDREIENMPVTFVYTGKLSGEELSGKVSIKNLGEDQYSETWTARKQRK